MSITALKILFPPLYMCLITKMLSTMFLDQFKQKIINPCRHLHYSSLILFIACIYFLSLLTPSSPSYLEEVLEIRIVVDASLEQRGSVDLAGAEADVGLHVGQLCGQDISDHLHRHVVPAHLLTNTQRPAHT